MTDELFDPHDLELRRMLRDLSAGPAAPSAARARLSSALHLGGPPGGPSGGTRKSGPAAREAAQVVPSVNAPLAKIAASANVGWILGGAGVAAVVGAWLATSRPPSGNANNTLPQANFVTSVPADPLSQKVNAPPALPVARDEPKATEGDLGASPRSSAAPPGEPAENVKADPRRGPDLSLAAERRMLEAARAALVAGEPKAGLDWAMRHAKQFPRGVLAEEREALFIDALVASGRYDDARRRADGFRTRYPGSLFAPSVSAALQAIP
ncbi:MAG: hypothetical protein ABW133_16975 [Polyangiaceae bacterium]